MTRNPIKPSPYRPLPAIILTYLLVAPALWAFLHLFHPRFAIPVRVGRIANPTHSQFVDFPIPSFLYPLLYPPRPGRERPHVADSNQVTSVSIAFNAHKSAKSTHFWSNVPYQSPYAYVIGLKTHLVETKSIILCMTTLHNAAITLIFVSIMSKNKKCPKWDIWDIAPNVHLATPCPINPWHGIVSP